MLPNLFFNAGLLAYQPKDIDFSIANSYLDWRQGADAQLVDNQGGFWFGEWTIEQTCYLLSYAGMKTPIEDFGSDYAIGREPSAVFCHFLNYYYRQPKTLQMLSELIQEITPPGNRESTYAN
ncbi:hypothetical protein [Thalassoroseus pseudoceratinae]|uniref:hypothetical protein n=1 Tax=Thalassoroseus pseudoceratinae TaxID=2713176 RepID=UPI00142143E8|nr:hypothetical protein [Thalassoroseus pseudoceratinae]